MRGDVVSEKRRGGCEEGETGGEYEVRDVREEGGREGREAVGGGGEGVELGEGREG